MSDLRRARKHAQQKRSQYDTGKSLTEALERIRMLEAETEAIKRLRRSRSSLVIKPSASTGTSEATAIACATDWHFGATVTPQEVNNLNEYSVAIAKSRAAKFFERVVRLTDKERQDVAITELILFLGGDLIQGALHLDTLMSDEVATPMKQAVILQQSLEAGLEYIKKHGNFKRVTVVCCDGNHGRITTHQHWSSRQGNALEYFLYYNLAARHPELNWVIADGIHVYLQVYENTLRFMHGDTIYYGGINGPYTYLNRRIYQWDVARRADFTFMGHLHQYIVGSRKWLINGSLIGYSAYSLSLGAEFQPPIQAFMLWDKKRGSSVNIPILF